MDQRYKSQTTFVHSSMSTVEYSWIGMCRLGERLWCVMHYVRFIPPISLNEWVHVVVNVVRPCGTAD